MSKFFVLACLLASTHLVIAAPHGGGGGARGGGGFSGGSRGMSSGSGFSGGSRGFTGGSSGFSSGSRGFTGGGISRGYYGGRGFEGDRYYGRGYGYGWGYPYGFGFGLGLGLGWGYPYYDYGYYGYGYPDYGYSPAYSYVPSPDYDYAPASSMQAPASSPSVVNQYFSTPARERQDPPPGRDASGQLDSSKNYLIAFPDGSVTIAIAYWTEGSTLHYVTRDRVQKSVPIASIDRRMTEQLNRERHIEFHLQ